eukprot:gene12159-600_t
MVERDIWIPQTLERDAWRGDSPPRRCASAQEANNTFALIAGEREGVGYGGQLKNGAMLAYWRVGLGIAKAGPA